MKNKKIILIIMIILLLSIVGLNLYYVTKFDFVYSDLKLEITEKTKINDTLNKENKSLYDEKIRWVAAIENQKELLEISKLEINDLIDHNNELQKNTSVLTENLNELSNNTNINNDNVSHSERKEEANISKESFLNKELKKKRAEIEQHVFDDLLREDCIRILNGSINVANYMYGNYTTLGYDFNKTEYDYDSNPMVGDYYLVSDMTYDNLKSYINSFFTFQVSESIIVDNVSLDSESENKLYRVYKDKVFTLGGEGGSSPVHTTYFEESIFEILAFDISEKSVTYRVYIPSVIDTTDEYEMDYRLKEIEFKYEKDVWKVNTIIKKLGFY